MYQAFTGGLGGIALAKHGKSRAINAENPHGEKGRGGMEASHLGPSRKGSPCLKDIEPGAVVTLAEMEGPGQINHILLHCEHCGRPEDKPSALSLNDSPSMLSKSNPALYPSGTGNCMRIPDYAGSFHASLR